jgi:RHS repeat-associated protein
MHNQKNTLPRRAVLLALALPLWIVGSGAGAAQVQQTRSYDYSAATGLLTKEVVEPASSKLCFVTAYEYDSFGNRAKTTQRNCNGSGSAYPGATATEAAAPADNAIVPRISKAQYSYAADGSSTVVTTNAAGHRQTSGFNASFGTVVSQQGPNDYRDANGNLLFSQWAYDSFGRKVLEKRPDGNGTTLKYELCLNVACPTVSGIVPTYVVTSTPVAGPIDVAARTTGSQNGPASKSYFDALDHVVRVEAQGSDVSGNSTLVYQDTQYDDLGRVSATSAPYFAGDSAVWTRLDHDKLGRVTVATAPDGSRTVTTYDGLRTTVTNDLSQSTTKVRNVLGQVVQVIDARARVLSLSYDPAGNLAQSKDSAGNLTTLHYDVRGRKLDMQDPDMGSWSYDYDAVGNLTRQVDARLQVTEMHYDVLNRMSFRNEPNLKTTWSYDSCANGVGTLCASTADNGYSRTLSYDNLGRPAGLTAAMGSNPSTVSYLATQSYDANGRPLITGYPANAQLKNVYTPLGFLKQVVNASGAGPAFYWRADLIDAQGRVRQHTLGNNVATVSTYDNLTGRLLSTAAGADKGVQNLSYGYDTLGNLKQRDDGVTGLKASYTYDSLNRLLSETRAGAGMGAPQYKTVMVPIDLDDLFVIVPVKQLLPPSPQTLAWTYDDIGNITSRSDVGSYAYGARPHAVTNIVGLVNGEANPVYAYDDNGNLLSTVAAGGTHVVGWNSFNMVDNVSRTFGGHTSRVDFLYGSDHERVRETAMRDGVGQRTTDYMNAARGASLFYEQESTTAGGVRKKVYLSAGGQTIGVLVFDGSNALVDTQYWHKDHLGSLTAVTNTAGAVVERLAYEPFGKRRNANGTTDPDGTLAGVTTARGFTEHEQLDEVALINMNGRIYDPAISRFLSADPGIQAPQFMQDYNRYSYTVNNPLAFFDPSGYDIAVDCDDCGSPWGGSWGSSGSSSGSSSTYYGYNYNPYVAGFGYTSNISLSVANTYGYNYQDPLGTLGLSLNLNTYGVVNAYTGDACCSSLTDYFSGTSKRLSGTYFFGGAGMDGGYIPSMLKAMKNVGISEPRAIDPSKYSGGTLMDATLGVGLLRHDLSATLKRDYEVTGTYKSLLENQGSGRGQLNLVGYSYGSEVAAQEASVLTRNGVQIDHLVLIGSPISNSFLASLQNNPLIRDVIVLNLSAKGDPLYAGIPYWEIALSAPKLVYQMTQGSGHFYYAPSNAQGDANRNQLAKDLYDKGLR